eukprot:15464020-Alexandrium_andersonii.AAC.1
MSALAASRARSAVGISLRLSRLPATASWSSWPSGAWLRPTLLPPPCAAWLGPGWMSGAHGTGRTMLLLRR